MSPVVRRLTIIGFVLLLGTPLVATLLALLQKPGETDEGSKAISTVIVANFACVPFMAIGLILLLVALVKRRQPANP